MSEKKIISILKNHGIRVHRINGKLYAEEVYTIQGVGYCDLVIVDPEKKTVHDEPLFLWLGY